MPFNEWGVGEGTLKEFFAWPSGEPDDTDNEDLKAMIAATHERDRHIEALQIDLFVSKTGLSLDDVVKAYLFDYEPVVPETIDQPGLVMIVINSDDPIYGLYKDGEPIAGFYASYRGMYQAGGYLAESDEHFFASDFAEAQPHNKWLPNYPTICSQIADDFVNGRRNDND